MLTLTGRAVLWPVVSCMVTVQLPAFCGVTVNAVLGPVPLVGEIVAIVPLPG